MSENPIICPNCKLDTTPNEPFCSRCGFDLKYGKTKKARRRGKCAFCEIYCTFTKEHIFPDWLSKSYPLIYRPNFQILGRPKKSEFFASNPIEYQEKDRRGHLYQNTVAYNVCKDCNTGWMSNLQIEAKPIIQDLIASDSQFLCDEKKYNLVLWCMMTCMNREYHSGIVTIQQWQRAEIMNKKIATGWRIAIGRMADTDCAGNSFHGSRSMPIGIGKGEFLKYQISYFCIEKICFFCISTIGEMTYWSLKFGGHDFEHVISRYGLEYILPPSNKKEDTAYPLINGDTLREIRSYFGAER